MDETELELIDELDALLTELELTELLEIDDTDEDDTDEDEGELLEDEELDILEELTDDTLDDELINCNRDSTSLTQMPVTVFSIANTSSLVFNVDVNWPD